MPIDFLTPAEPKRKTTVIVDIGTFSIRGSKLLVVQYLVGYLQQVHMMSLHGSKKNPMVKFECFLDIRIPKKKHLTSCSNM